MEKTKIALEPRKIIGKKVKKLRAEGLLPANLFGKDIKSKALQVPEKNFRQVFKKAGETAVIEIKVNGETYPALISNVQRDPVTDKIIHADLHKVNLKEKIAAKVPVKLTGQSPAEKSRVGLILQTLNELEIESLPGDIPHEVSADVSSLSEVGETVSVKDLKIDKNKIDVKNDPEEAVVSVQTAEMKEESVEEEKEPEKVEATEEKAEEEEGAEGALPERGEEKKETGEEKSKEGPSEQKE